MRKEAHVKEETCMWKVPEMQSWEVPDGVGKFKTPEGNSVAEATEWLLISRGCYSRMFDEKT